MKLKFSNLEPGDTVWCVFDKTYKNGKQYNLDLISANIIKNDKYGEERTHGYPGDEWTQTVEGWYITIKPNAILPCEYRRSYDQFYDDKAHMTMCGDFWNDGPHIEVFVNKEDAIDYLRQFMNNILERNNEEIHNLEEYNKEIKETLNKFENI